MAVHGWHPRRTKPLGGCLCEPGRHACPCCLGRAALLCATSLVGLAWWQLVPARQRAVDMLRTMMMRAVCEQVGYLGGGASSLARVQARTTRAGHVVSPALLACGIACMRHGPELCAALCTQASRPTLTQHGVLHRQTGVLGSCAWSTSQQQDACGCGARSSCHFVCVADAPRARSSLARLGCKLQGKAMTKLGNDRCCARAGRIIPSRVRLCACAACCAFAWTC